jgi:hypothetical protein
LIKLNDIARVCHEANRAWCISNGDNSQAGWEDAPDWQRQSSIESIIFRIENPNAKLSSQHDQWMKDKIEAGWVWGPVKNEATKEHPCIVPYEELSEFDKRKDALFAAIVLALIEKV